MSTVFQQRNKLFCGDCIEIWTSSSGDHCYGGTRHKCHECKLWKYQTPYLHHIHPYFGLRHQTINTHTVVIFLFQVPLANSIWQLTLPHFGLGLGLGIVDSSLMPLLAKLVEDRHIGSYGSVYAVSQTAVSLAYGIGPLLGGYIMEKVGFPSVMRGLGVINILYSPILLYLAKTNPRGEPEVSVTNKYINVNSILLNCHCYMNNIYYTHIYVLHFR